MGTRPGTNLSLGLLVLAAAALLAAILFFFNPGQHGFYPFCLFYRMTGLQCPGCGSLRALHQLLHGNILEALRLNALLTLSLPFFVWLTVRSLAPLFGFQPIRLTVKPGWLWTGLAIVAAFGILRNL